MITRVDPRSARRRQHQHARRLYSLAGLCYDAAIFSYRLSSLAAAVSGALGTVADRLSAAGARVRLAARAAAPPAAAPKPAPVAPSPALTPVVWEPWELDALQQQAAERRNADNDAAPRFYPIPPSAFEVQQ